MDMDEPVDGYDEFTVEDAKAAVRAGALEPAAALAYEREGADRVTLTRWLENRVEAQAEAEADDADAEPETVAVASTRSGMIAGMLFRSAHQPRVVKRTVRVEEAISNGDLRVLDYEP